MANMDGIRRSAADQGVAPGDQPIDFAHLFRMTLGDHDLAHEVLTLFDQQASILIARMAAVDPSCVAALAHTIKGSARGIGAWPVARAAEAVERAPLGDLEPAVEALATAAAEARAAIADLLRLKHALPA
jgi:HPt (histidine-containing phosphotransfer) domain-containing protein